jgi:hypothetical protein
MSVGSIGMRVYLPPVDGERVKTLVGELVKVQPKPEIVGRYGTITDYEVIDFIGRPIHIPVITLDDGKIVRGYECWWTESNGDDPCHQRKS